MRPFWSVVKLLIMVVIGTLVLTFLVPVLISSFVGGVQTEMDIPYFSGSGDVTIGSDQFTIHAPVTLELTGAFWFATVTAGLGIAARIYRRRIALPTPRV
jgi:uncharacterized membrane protein